MTKFMLLLFCACTCSTLFGQTFSKGYIAKTDGARTAGYLKRTTNAELVQSLEFKESETSMAVTIFKPQDLKEFGFDAGDKFEAVRFTDPLDSNRVKTRFARLILEGYYTVYDLAKGAVSDYLIKSADTTYLIYDDRQSSMGFDLQLGNFRNTLLFLARDCDGLNIQFENLLFREDEIVNLVNRINSCHKSASVIHHQKAKYKSSFVIYGGASGLKDKFSQQTAGVEVQLSDIKVSRKLFYVIGLHYSKSSTYNFTQIYYPVERLKQTTLKEVFSVPIMAQYQLTEHVVQPYSYVGFSAAYRKINYKQRLLSEGFQGKYGIAIIGGVGVEIYPVKFFAIKVDWRYELHLNYPTLGVAFRF